MATTRLPSAWNTSSNAVKESPSMIDALPKIPKKRKTQGEMSAPPSLPFTKQPSSTLQSSTPTSFTQYSSSTRGNALSKPFSLLTQKSPRKLVPPNSNLQRENLEALCK